MFCVKCGNKLSDDISFCPKCGNQIRDELKRQSVQEKNVQESPLVTKDENNSKNKHEIEELDFESKSSNQDDMERESSTIDDDIQKPQIISFEESRLSDIPVTNENSEQKNDLKSIKDYKVSDEMSSAEKPNIEERSDTEENLEEKRNLKSIENSKNSGEVNTKDESKTDDYNRNYDFIKQYDSQQINESKDNSVISKGNTVFNQPNNITQNYALSSYQYNQGNSTWQQMGIHSNQNNKETPLINKILIAAIAIVVLVCIIFLAINLAKKENSRVVMIYMVGSNLESKSGLATRDLIDLDYNKLTANKTKVILIAGGTTSWKNNYIDVNQTSIYMLGESGFEKVDARAKNNMGSPDNLSYFLSYVYNNYKASKYDFIYWNHGGAVDGSEYDDFTADHLMLVEMAKAFENSPFKEKNKLEVISFRTCLNSTVEIANIYKNYAKYLVASEEITIGSPADSAIRFLNDVEITDTGIDYGKKQIETYKELVSNSCNYASIYQKDQNYCIDSTYSITDLSKIDNLTEAFNTFSGDLNKALSSSYNEFAKLRANIPQYGGDQLGYDMIDLYDFVETFNKYSPNGTNVLAAIDDAVIYNWTNTKNSHGLSIYFPYNDKWFLNTYSNISVANNYTSLVNNFYQMKTGTRISSYNNFSSTKVDVAKERTKADVELELTEEQVKNMTKASYLVFADTKDGYYQIIYGGSDVKVEGNKLKASIKDRLLRLSDSEYTDDSTWILAKEDKVTDDYVELKAYIYLSNTPALFFSKTYPSTVIIRIDKEHPEGYIKAIYTNLNDTQETDSKDKFSLFAPSGIKLTDYNFVSVVSSRYKLLDENKKYNPNWAGTSNQIIEGYAYRTNMVKFVKENFESGYDYYVVFRVFDVANNEYDSNPIKLN